MISNQSCCVTRFGSPLFLLLLCLHLFCGQSHRGSGGGIPRLLDNKIASAIAMLDTAWIIATGGGLFCLCSFIILKISSFSPYTWARPLTLSCAINGL